MRSALRNNVLDRHCWPADAAIAECIAEGQERLVVGGITVVPHDPEISPGDRKEIEGVIRAVGPAVYRSIYPTDE